MPWPALGVVIGLHAFRPFLGRDADGVLQQPHHSRHRGRSDVCQGVGGVASEARLTSRTLSIHRGSSVSTISSSQTVIQDRVFSRGNSCSSAQLRLKAFSKARRAALWTSIAANTGSLAAANTGLASARAVLPAAMPTAVERKRRRVVTA